MGNWDKESKEAGSSGAHEISLSKQARSLWGKTDYGEGIAWLPLYMHMLDSAAIAGYLWDEWLPAGTRSLLVSSLGGEDCLARKMACFIAGVHDIGKATPVFQGKPCGYGHDGESHSLAWKPANAGLPMYVGSTGRRATSHPCASYWVLRSVLTDEYGWEAAVAERVAAVVGTHHGKPLGRNDVSGLKEGSSNYSLRKLADLGWSDRCGGAWKPVQSELVDLVRGFVGLAKEELASLAQARLLAPAASVLTGLVIMVDWIASDQELFPLVALNPYDADDDYSNYISTRSAPLTEEDARDQAWAAWRRFGCVPPWRPAQSTDEAIDGLYRDRFGFSPSMSPRPMQRAAVEVARSVETPGLVIVEAPMGEGKTEAALAAAEILAARTGRGGVCVALPTMATTDAMFGRVYQWLAQLPRAAGADGRSVFLAHGKAQLNEEFQGIERAGQTGRLSSMGEDLFDGANGRELRDGVVVSQWMQGRKKGLLSNFVVCTVDQVLMGALQMKHLSLRHLALANKVVVIDECHAYDSYMRCYLNRVLEWLGGMGAPVVLLSATLPQGQRQQMLQSYQRGAASPRGEDGSRSSAPKRAPRRGSLAARAEEAVEGAETKAPPCSYNSSQTAYPLITYTSGNEVLSAAPEPSGRTQEVRLELISDDDEALVRCLEERLEGGGCAGVICTTVTRAQRTAAVLRNRFGKDGVLLTHARFTDLDRMANEKHLRELLGPRATLENGKRPERLVVVGTQVLEQSLDIDFDVLVSDVAPIDLLMQRLGRLHRHARTRPFLLGEATCFLRGIEHWDEAGPVFPRAVKTVYPVATLMEPLGVLGLTDETTSCVIQLPADIARTVRSAYGDEIVLPPLWRERYEVEKQKRSEQDKSKQSRAGACLLVGAEHMVCNGGSLVEWFEPEGLSRQDQDYGPRAVRDTGETVEVLVLERRGDRLFLLPWIGDASCGIEGGAEVSVFEEPSDAVARVAAQSAVRLPQSLCRSDELDFLIGELEQGCGSLVGEWQRSPWLAGCLVLPLERDAEGNLCTHVRGREVMYSREEGLIVRRAEV